MADDANIHRVMELRQYRMNPGMRDTLVDLFHTVLTDGLARHGIRVLGLFRDLDDPDNLVWLRDFPDMTARLRSMQSFYSSRDWLDHRPAANATMITFDNVLLLRAAWRGWAPRLDGDFARLRSSAQVTAMICHPDPADMDAFAARFESEEAPRIEASGQRVVGAFRSEEARNDYPALPVREDRPVFCWFAGHGDGQPAVPATAAWDEALSWLSSPPQMLRLEPA